MQKRPSAKNAVQMILKLEEMYKDDPENLHVEIDNIVAEFLPKTVWIAQQNAIERAKFWSFG